MLALSSMALPNLLDAINHLRLGMSTPSDEDEPSEEQQDLLELLAVKGVPKSSITKDVYQKFMNILNARPHIQDPAPAPKPREPMGDPPVPPGRVNPPPTSGQGNPPPNLGASSGSNWEPGRSPTDEEEPKKLFSYRNPLYTKPSVPPPSLIPSHLFPTRSQKQVRRNQWETTPTGQEALLQFIPGTLLWITLKGIQP